MAEVHILVMWVMNSGDKAPKPAKPESCYMMALRHKIL
jgi:hypothetical protein